MPLGAPKYSLIVDQLLRDIRKGTLKVGAALPTETELMRAFGVSRHTVRSAIQVLRQQGIVASRQGQGSHVLASEPSVALVEQFQSVDELIKFGQVTKRILLDHCAIEADAELAAIIGCDPGRRLVMVHMLRRGIAQDSDPIAYVTLWVDALYESVIQDLEPSPMSVAALLHQRFNVTVGAVQQTISATILDAEAAALLKQDKGSAALVLDRFYMKNADTPAFLRARSICLANSVQIKSSFRSWS